MSHIAEVNQTSMVADEGVPPSVAEQLPMRETVPVVIGTISVLLLVSVCTFGDGTDEDLLVAVWSGRANEEIIIAVAVDSVCLTRVSLPS